MKIVLISGASSIHTVRWANGLSSAGHQVHVITQHKTIDRFNNDVELHIFPYRGPMGYFTMVPKVRKLINKINPDVVNAHYASGYGTTARFVNFKPLVLSVWGSDVYDFPEKSPIHKRLVRKNLMAANIVASTSHCMAKQTRKIAPNLSKISITPFGVDIKKFDVNKRSYNDRITIGTVKVLAHKYGIDTLINSFSILHKKLAATQPNIANKLHLKIVGSGPQEKQLQKLAASLNLSNKIEFVGRVPHDRVPSILAEMDIFVALSRLDSESFGVAVLEASAAGCPVVVSEAGGLPEVTVEGKTGLIVERENANAAASAIEQLINNPVKRLEMGIAGKQHVTEKYNWSNCIIQMESVLLTAINNTSV